MPDPTVIVTTEERLREIIREELGLTPRHAEFVVMTSAQAATMLGYSSPQVFRNDIRKLSIPAHHIGTRDMRFIRSELVAWKTARDLAPPPVRKRPAPPNTVYVLRGHHTGLIKIGMTNRLSRRLWELRHRTRQRLDVLACIPGNRDVERRLLQRFDAFREHGEWFRPEAELLEFIAELRAEAGATEVTQ